MGLLNEGASMDQLLLLLLLLVDAANLDKVISINVLFVLDKVIIAYLILLLIAWFVLLKIHVFWNLLFLIRLPLLIP